MSQLNDHCPSCGSKKITAFYDVKDVPVHTCVMLPTSQEALNFPKAKIVLVFCESCGFISNLAFDSSIINYSTLYEDQQIFSSTFNSFAQSLAKRLIKKHELFNKTILEIGCGKGDFLALMCELGNNSGIGVDPAFIKNRVHSRAQNRLTFVQDYYSERYSDYNGEFVCCRHTLEHIFNTGEFLRNVRRAIGNRLDTVVFFELPEVTRVLQELAFWDIYHEHCSYFSSGSLARLFRSCNFEVVDISKDFDDQYLLVEAKPVNQKSDKIHELEETVEDLAKMVTDFSVRINETLVQWRRRLSEFQADGKRVVVWGSGSKCVSFMTTLGVCDEIELVVDINPFRHGKFLPGLGKQVMSPKTLQNYKPDVVIVMNRIYIIEIRQALGNMGLSPEVISI